MENVNSAALTCRAETVPVTEAQAGAGEGLLPFPEGSGSCHHSLGDTRGTPTLLPTGAGGTVLVGSRWGLPGWVWGEHFGSWQREGKERGSPNQMAWMLNY